MAAKALSALVTVFLLLSTVSATAVFFHDHTGSALKKDDGSQLTAEGLAATLATLAGNVLTIDTQAAGQVSAVLHEGMFSRPEAVLALHVVGADLEYARLEGWAQHSVAPCCNSNRVAQHVALAAPHTPALGQGQECSDEELEALATQLGGSYTPGAQPLSGRLALPGGDGAVVELELGGGVGGEEARVWAVELATALKEAETAARAPAGPQRYAWTLVGLQALRTKLGASSPQFLAAQHATLAVATHIDQLLAAQHGGSMVSVVVVSGPVEVAEPTLGALLHWKGQLEVQRSASHSRVLEESGASAPAKSSLYYAAPSNSSSEDTYAMTGTASAWVLGIMLLITLIGTIWCMCTMQFKKDSLLFGVPKQSCS